MSGATQSRPTKRAFDGWDDKRQCACSGRCSLEARSPDLRHFRAFSTPKQNPALGVLSTPAHPQVTHTVGRWHQKGFIIHDQYRIRQTKYNGKAEAVKVYIYRGFHFAHHPCLCVVYNHGSVLGWRVSVW